MGGVGSRRVPEAFLGFRLGDGGFGFASNGSSLDRRPSLSAFRSRLVGPCGLERGDDVLAHGRDGLPRRASVRIGLVRDEQLGQAAVEMAVLIPVIVVAALLAFNVMRYAELCARFDRVAPDAVLAHGVSPVGPSGELAGVDAVTGAIKEGMGGASCEVEVAVEDLGLSGSGGALLTLAAGTTRFTCTLSYTPWPSSVSIAGAGFRLPELAKHERTIVVDRWKAAIVT